MCSSDLEQLLNFFELGKELELFNRSKIDLFDDRMLALMFFQPSTRTRMSFQTAMERMGGNVIVEANPKVTSSVAKEEAASRSRFPHSFMYLRGSPARASTLRPGFRQARPS